jgi:hypothetical protein
MADMTMSRGGSTPRDHIGAFGRAPSDPRDVTGYLKACAVKR